MKTIRLLACALVFSGCAAKYEQPQSGDRARIRMVRTGPAMMTSFDSIAHLPAEGCFKRGSTHDEQRLAMLDNPLVRDDSDLGIPGNDRADGARFSEAYIRAGKPFVLETLILGVDIQKMTQCRIAALWNPAPSADYEATVNWTGRSCRLVVSKIELEAGGNQKISKRPVDATYASFCEEPAR